MLFDQLGDVWKNCRLSFPAIFVITCSQQLFHLISLKPSKRRSCDLDISIYIHITSNWPNTIYATHEVINGVDNLHNYECFLSQPFNLATQLHILIFVDN